MPIRFRCPYCNQLMGIAHRKAGHTVRCPTCAGQVVVPEPEAGQVAPEPGPAPLPRDPVFERSDFDEILQAPGSPSSPLEPPGGVAAPSPARAGGAVHIPSRPDFDVEPLDAPVPVRGPSPAPGGIVLSPARATVLTVAVIVTVAIAFGAGLVVGKFYL